MDFLLSMKKLLFTKKSDVKFPRFYDVFDYINIRTRSKMFRCKTLSTLTAKKCQLFYAFLWFTLNFHALKVSRVNHKTILWLIINTHRNCNRILMYDKVAFYREFQNKPRIYNFVFIHFWSFSSFFSFSSTKKKINKNHNNKKNERAKQRNKK